MVENTDPLKALPPENAEATRWFLRLNDEEVDENTLDAFDQWCRADERNASAFARLQAIWTATGAMPGLREDRLRERRLDRRGLLRGVSAAVVTGGVLFAGSRLAFGPHPFADARTGHGERRSITLADGSTIEMSTATAVSFEFDKSRRLVRLLDGEACFSVATDPQKRPFTVEAVGGRTTALGTVFSVACRDRGATVSAVQHAVKVAAAGETRTLEEGMSLHYDDRGIGVPATLQSIALAWRSGRLVFLSRPLGEVIAELDRWRAGKTILIGKDLAHRSVTLMVETDDVTSELALLAQVLPVEVTEITPLLTIIRSTREI